MSAENDGGPAFPTADELCDGMSIRDYFAGLALTGVLAQSHRAHEDADELALAAYKIADAMLEARKRGPK